MSNVRFMIFKCNKSRCSCYTLDAWSCRLINLEMIFVSTFIDISNLIALFCMFIWRCHKEVFYVFVGAFHGYCLLSMQRQKRLVTVLFLQCSLLTSSEMYLLQIDIWCFCIMSINSFSNTFMLAFWRSAFWFKPEVFSPNITFILFL